MELGRSRGVCAAVIAMLAITQVNGKCPTGSPCDKNGGSAPVPGCSCLTPNPMLDPEAFAKAMASSNKDDGRSVNKFAGVIGGPTGSNEVEVLTLDVNVANRVRSANVSLAAKIAKMMGVPVSRVNVTPYSWTPDQFGPAPFLQKEHDRIWQEEQKAATTAFLQMDHERCDCHSADGGVDKGQGFNLMSHKTDSIKTGVKVASDTSILTVSQYKALNDFKEQRAAEGSLDDDTQESPARIQLLTRDPCLVKQLHSDAKKYADRIAVLLDIPAKAVILQPPPVKGTIGLLQLEASDEPETAAPTLLAVRHCDRAPQAMSLLATGQQPTQSAGATSVKTAAAAAMNTPAAASAPAAALALKPKNKLVQPLADTEEPPSFAVLSPSWASSANATTEANATNATNATVSVAEVAMPRLVVPLKLSNVNSDVLMSSSLYQAAFSTLVKAAIAEAASMPGGDSLTPEHVELAFYPGDGTTDNSNVKVKLGESKSDSAEEAIMKLLRQDPSVAVPKAAVAEAKKVADASKAAPDAETAGANAGVIVEARVKVPEGSNLALVAKKLKDEACNELGPVLKESKAKLEAFTGGDIGCVAMIPTSEPVAAQQPDQTNRAWISFWTVVVEPPFAKLGGRKLVEMVNTPGSELARLLPQTLAYVPGVMDRSMGAVNELTPIMLPPPEESSASFGLRSTRFDEEDATEIAKTEKDKKDLETRTVKTRRVWELDQAAKAVAAGQITKNLIEQARQQFLGAARAHVHALRPSSAMTGPEIMPPTKDDMAESDYPNVPPTKLKAESLAQVSQTLRTVKRVDPKKDVDLSKKMPLKAQEQGFSGKKVAHVDGETVTKDWRDEYGNAPEKKDAKKSGGIQMMASAGVLLATLALHCGQ